MAESRKLNSALVVRSAIAGDEVATQAELTTATAENETRRITDGMLGRRNGTWTAWRGRT